MMDQNAINEIKRIFSPDSGAEQWHNAQPNSLGFGAIHYSLIRVVRPELALCVGSRYGFIPACMAMAIKENGFGKLHFVDANYDDTKHGYNVSYGGVGYWSRPASEVFSYNNLYEWIEMFVERTDSYFSNHKETKYQYVYLDGNHSYEGIKYDCTEAISRLDKNGIITLHDALVIRDLFGINKYIVENHKAIFLGVDPGLAIIQPNF
jgi:hypothetical protein